MKTSNSVNIDAVSDAPESRKTWEAIATDHKDRLLIFECVTSDFEVHRSRIEGRVRNLYGISETTWKSVEARRSNYQPWPIRTIVIDTTFHGAGILLRALQIANE